MSYYITAMIKPIDIVTLKIGPKYIEEIARINGIKLSVDTQEINDKWILKEMYSYQNHLPISELIDVVQNVINGQVEVEIIDEDDNVLYNDIISEHYESLYIIMEGDEPIEVFNAVNPKMYLERRGGLKSNENLLFAWV
jgi:hypothetical protein